jgi:hypothetical protein
MEKIVPTALEDQTTRLSEGQGGGGLDAKSVSTGN